MQFFKITLYFFFSLAILPLSEGVVHAKMQYLGMDRNRDTVITRAEWRGESDRSFDNRDLNGDGVLSGNEVKRGAVCLNGADTFQTLDLNNNGIISIGEWTGTLRSFDGLDLNHDNRLSRNEFYNQEQYSVSIFRELDQNRDGRISRNEWRGTNVVFTRLDYNRDNFLSLNEFTSRQSNNLVDQIFQDIFGGR